MTTQIQIDPKEIMAQNLRMVRRYAEGTALPNKHDRMRRMRELFGIGLAYGLTEKELVRLVLGDVLKPRKACECPTCKHRRKGQYPLM